MSEHPHLPADEAAQVLGIHRRTLNRYLRNGLIASFKHGGRTFIHASEIDSYFARRQHAGDLKRAAAEKQARRDSRIAARPRT